MFQHMEYIRNFLGDEKWNRIFKKYRYDYADTFFNCLCIVEDDSERARLKEELHKIGFWGNFIIFWIITRCRYEGCEESCKTCTT
jgi:hypothetical protein